MNKVPAKEVGPSDEGEVSAAAMCLSEGGVVAIPTDTLYGLAADAFNAGAIEKVFAVKERPEGLALPVLLASVEQLPQVAREADDALWLLAETLWPGPLTVVLNRNPALPERLTAGQPTVAVRVPDHWLPRELARQLGRPITGTSANISGAEDPRSPEELQEQVGDRVDRVLALEPSPAGTASTIIDLTAGEPRLLREGVIPFERVESLLKGS